MSQRVQRDFGAPSREGRLSWDERWRGPDQGLITCWEIGRESRRSNPELAIRAMNDELPPLGWKGGVKPGDELADKKKATPGKKYGSLKYLAEWQALRGEDLDICLDEEVELKCSKTGVRVTFTSDLKKLG